MNRVYTLILVTACLATAAVYAQTPFTVVKAPHPNPNGYQNILASVSGSSTSDIWAVGQCALHYNGKEWKAFAAPNLNGYGVNQLQSVADISPDNVWAVGYVNLNEDNPNQLIEHFDGKAWSVNAGPEIPSGDVPYLESVTAISANDIWATGSVLVDGGTAFFPLFEHYDGTSWTAFAEGLVNTFMFGVSADASNDIWAVGTGEAANHYDGNAWNVVPMTIPGGGENALFGVTALAPNNVWAVGFYVEEQNEARPRITLIEQWNGTSWQVVPSPNPGGSSNSNYLSGVTAISANDIWAYGASIDIATDFASTLVLHWDGSSWSIVPSPDPLYKKINDDSLSGGTVLPTGDLWLVGGESVFRPLILNATGQ